MQQTADRGAVGDFKQEWGYGRGFLHSLQNAAFGGWCRRHNENPRAVGQILTRVLKPGSVARELSQVVASPHQPPVPLQEHIEFGCANVKDSSCIRPDAPEALMPAKPLLPLGRILPGGQPVPGPVRWLLCFLGQANHEAVRANRVFPVAEQSAEALMLPSIGISGSEDSVPTVSSGRDTIAGGEQCQRRVGYEIPKRRRGFAVRGPEQ